jgi:hypothetical protein
MLNLAVRKVTARLYNVKGVLKQGLAVPWLRRLVAGLIPQKRGFNHGPVHVGFVVEELVWDGFFTEYFGFHLSVSFPQCSVLFVLVCSLTE